MRVVEACDFSGMAGRKHFTGPKSQLAGAGDYE